MAQAHLVKRVKFSQEMEKEVRILAKVLIWSDFRKVAKIKSDFGQNR